MPRSELTPLPKPITSGRYSQETDESQSSETKTLIDSVHNKISEMHKLIRKAEEEA
jgi:hypothetical protein